MFISRRLKGNGGWTLMETLVATGIFGVFMAGFMTTYVLSVRSYAALNNYILLDTA